MGHLFELAPRDRGWIDHHSGDAPDQCPYPPHTPEAELWLAGWNEAEERARYRDMAELIFPRTPGKCRSCGTGEYTILELNLSIDQANECYACLTRKRYIP